MRSGDFIGANLGQAHRKLSAMDQVFAGIFVILLLALITDIIMRAIKRFLYPWETE